MSAHPKAAVALMVVLAQVAPASACSVVETRTIEVSSDENLPGDEVIISRFDNGAVHFRANMDTNTDGDPQSYHPDNANASNTLCNGINLNIPSGWTGTNALVAYYREKTKKLAVKVNGIGKKIGKTVQLTGKESCRAFLGLYQEAKAVNWKVDSKTPKVHWIAIARYGGNLPCIQGADDPAPGFFVSQTAWQDGTLPVCDQRRYVDATKIVNIVLPSAGFLDQWNIKVGNTAFVTKGDLAPIATFVADSSKGRVGEGSTALVRRLSQAGYTSAYPIDYFVMPGPKVSKFSTNSAIAKEAKSIAADIGFVVADCLVAVGAQ